MDAGDHERDPRANTIRPARPDRPFCPYFTTCGGCSLQHLDDIYEASAQSRSGRRWYDQDHGRGRGQMSTHGEGRRRATLHVRDHEAGYMRARSHDLLNIETCPILVPSLLATPTIARSGGTVSRLRLHPVHGDRDEFLDVAIKTEKRMGLQRLVPLAQRLQLARLSLNSEPVQTAPPAVRMGKATVELSIGGFLQATGSRRAYQQTWRARWNSLAKSVADLFCNTSPLALRLAEKAKVFAADYDMAGDHRAAAPATAVQHTTGLKPLSGCDLACTTSCPSSSPVMTPWCSIRHVPALKRRRANWRNRRSKPSSPCRANPKPSPVTPRSSSPVALQG